MLKTRPLLFSHYPGVYQHPAKREEMPLINMVAVGRSVVWIVGVVDALSEVRFVFSAVTLGQRLQPFFVLPITELLFCSVDRVLRGNTESSPAVYS